MQAFTRFQFFFYICICIFYIQGAQVTAATSGNGNLVLGDNTGNVHLVKRTYQVSTFRAYEISLTLAEQVQHSSFLFTIGVSAVQGISYATVITYVFVMYVQCMFNICFNYHNFFHRKTIQDAILQ